MKKWICIIGLVVVAASCVSTRNLDLRSDYELCKMYHVATANQQTSIREELDRRNAIKDWEWYLIGEKKIMMGMSRCALYCSWGPGMAERSWTGSWGHSIQHQYGLYSRYTIPKYVYTKNGKVTSWSQ